MGNSIPLSKGRRFFYSEFVDIQNVLHFPEGLPFFPHFLYRQDDLKMGAEQSQQLEYLLPGDQQVVEHLVRLLLPAPAQGVDHGEDVGIHISGDGVFHGFHSDFSAFIVRHGFLDIVLQIV